MPRKKITKRVTRDVSLLLYPGLRVGRKKLTPVQEKTLHKTLFGWPSGHRSVKTMAAVDAWLRLPSTRLVAKELRTKKASLGARLHRIIGRSSAEQQRFAKIGEKLRWEHMPEREKQRRLDALQAGRKAFWSSPIGKEDVNKILSSRRSAWFERLPSEKQERLREVRRLLNSKAPRAEVSAALKEFWNSLTPKERKVSLGPSPSKARRIADLEKGRHR
ncbi:hypothetical protein HY546_02680 [archaeon]|nr:hypothetical protein [archaeon]